VIAIRYPHPLGIVISPLAIANWVFYLAKQSGAPTRSVAGAEAQLGS
jgi:hypothetical protein